MRKLRNALIIILVLLSALLLPSCSMGKTCDKIKLGSDMPVWVLEGSVTKSSLPEDAASRHLTKVYKTDSDLPNVYVYTYPKDSMSLEEIGNTQASEYNVFCNMITDHDKPCANFIHRYDEGNEVYIAQNFMYEASNSFVKITFLHKTEETAIGDSGAEIRMMKEYSEEEIAVDFASFAHAYETESTLLPSIGISEFAKNNLTLEDHIDMYDEKYDLIKGEIIHRNDIDAAFIGYINDGIFSVRAIIDNGNDFIMLTADDTAERFQHVVNALIDTMSGVN